MALSSSTGRFGPTPLVGGFFGYGTLFAAHLDDGPTVDLAVSEYDDRFSLAFGNGDGTFRLNEYDFGGRTLVSADLDLDGHTDLVVSRNSTDVALGGGDGSFTPGQALGLAGPAGVMRIDADAYPDLLFATSDSLLAWRNRGDATFEPWAAWRGGGSRLITRDLNGDGRDDVVMQRAGSLLVVRLGGNAGPALRGPARGRRARSLGAETVYETAAEISDVQLADLDGDDHLDLVAEHRTVPPEWLRGRGDGTFDAPVALALPPAERLRFADWNGDGKSDAASLAGKVAISFGTGGASFTAPIWLGMGYNGAVTVPTDLAVGDFDGDGRPDVAVLRAHVWPDDLINYVEFMFDRIEPLVVVGGARPSPAGALLIGRSGPNPMRSVTRFRFLLERRSA